MTELIYRGADLKELFETDHEWLFHLLAINTKNNKPIYIYYTLDDVVAKFGASKEDIASLLDGNEFKGYYWIKIPMEYRSISEIMERIRIEEQLSTEFLDKVKKENTRY